MRREIERKLKIYAVDVAMIFLAIQVTTVLRDGGRIQMQAQIEISAMDEGAGLYRGMQDL